MKKVSAENSTADHGGSPSIASSPSMPDDDLTGRVMRGGFWVLVTRFFTQVFYFGRLIILARLLSPHDFGLMGFAALSLNVLETFTQTGFYEALIQKKERTEQYVDAAWTILVGRGLFLSVILFVAAPLAASFFRAPEAVGLIRVFGLSAFISSLTNIGVMYFQKDLDFFKQFLFKFSEFFSIFAFSLALALVLKNAWALVLGSLAGTVAQLAVSYLIHPHRPRLNFDLPRIKDLFRYGRWVLGSDIVFFSVIKGNNIVVGRLLGSTMLGLFQQGQTISNTPATEISRTLSMVTFPAYAKLQDDPVRLKQAFLRVLGLISFLIFPLAFFTFVLAGDFTALFLGKPWLPMVPALQVLTLAGLFRALTGTAASLFYGVGKPGLETRGEVVRFLTLAVLIIPFTIWWGILGTAAATTASALTASFVFFRSALSVNQSSGRELLRPLLAPLLNSALASLVLLGLREVLGYGFVPFAVCAAGGGGAYLLLAFLFNRALFVEILSLTLRYLPIRRRLGGR